MANSIIVPTNQFKFNELLQYLCTLEQNTSIRSQKTSPKKKYRWDQSSSQIIRLNFMVNEFDEMER